MNAKERRKDRKAKELIKLGRKAQVAISIASESEAAARGEAERLGTELEQKLAQSQSLEETVARAAEAIREVQAKCAEDIARAVADGKAQLAVTREEFLDAIKVLQEEHAKKLAEVEGKLAVSEAFGRALREEMEDPRKLRQRLQAKQERIEELQREVSRLRSQPLTEIRYLRTPEAR